MKRSKTDTGPLSSQSQLTIPPFTAISVPGASQNDKPELDCMERALRDRQIECEERKKKILEQYSTISKQGAGPKVWV